MSKMRTFFVNTFILIFKCVVQCYTFVSLPFYYILQKPYKTLSKCQFQRSVQLNPSDPYSPWVRTTETQFHVLTTNKSAAEAMEMIRQLYPLNRRAIGYRKVIHEELVTNKNGKEVRIDGKALRKFRLSPYLWMTYGEVFDRVDCIARGLVLNGFQRGDKIIILAETCPDNLIFLQVAIKVGAVFVTVFATLGDEGISHCINETKAKIVYTTYDLLPKVSNLLEKCQNISTIIYVNSNLSSNNNNNAYSLPNSIQLLSTTKLYNDGKENILDLTGMALGADDLQVISYTSGTTGQPKGISLTSAQMTKSGISVSAAMEKFMAEPEKHCYIAYLPQSHSLELSIETYAFMGGCPIGFASPFTLNESAPGLANGEICDLKLLKPTIMITVPLVLDRMRKEIYHKLNARTPVSADIFTFLINYKSQWTQKGYVCPIVNRVLCPKVKVQFGGRLQHMVVGGAALSPDLQTLIKSALDITLVQGYGATETFGAVLCMDDYDLSLDRCGAPLKDIQIRLSDWPEGGYTATDTPNPRGELVVGGYGVATGYYNNTELTDESFTSTPDGRRWFRTGDIGEVFPDGTFKIIDRKKDLIKLVNGEYFSLGKIESCLKNCTFVDNICVIGDKFRNYLIALIIPNQKSLQILANSLHLNEESIEQLCENKLILETVLKDINDSGLQYKLNRRELPLKIKICAEEWTPDNGMLTAAMKLKRNNIINKYKKEIEHLYS